MARMVCGVVTVEFRPTRDSAPVRTVRILIRNAEHMHECIVRAVAAAIELQPVHIRQYYVTAADFVRVDFDAVA